MKIRAERKAGELLKGMDKLEGRPKKEKGLHDATVLRDLGVEKTQSHRWQRMADIPEPVFEKHVAETVEARRELTKIDENFHRNEGTVLERAELSKRRKQMYLALHPETGHGGDRKSEKARDQTEIISVRSKPAAFAKDAAAKRGVTERTIRHEISIGDRLTDRSKTLLRNTPTADHKTQTPGAPTSNTARPALVFGVGHFPRFDFFSGGVSSS